MPRISPLQGGLSRAARSCSPAPLRAPFRAFTTTTPNAELRDKLWKGEAPGSKDPYTERPAEDTVQVSEIGEAAPKRKLSLRQQYIANAPIIVPQVRREALAEKQVEGSPMYEPAQSLDDLVEPPSLEDWWEQPGNWGYLNHFKGFAPPEKTQSRDVVEFFLRRAVAEVLVLREAGKLTEMCQGGKWTAPLKPALEEPISITVQDGVGSVQNGGKILEDLERKGGAVEWRKFWGYFTEEKVQPLIKGSDAAWKDMRLDDELKFAIRKRLFQFTGNYIPDAKLGAITLVKHLLTFGTLQPKPTRLAQELEQKNLFEELANVRMQDTKVRQIQKETEVGRWKVIEEELEKRGLPATGTRDLPGNNESKRLRGVR